MFIMKKLKNNLSSILLCIFEIVVGILLLIDPVSFTKGIIFAAGIALVVVGIISIVKYFKAEINEAVTGQYLTKGLIALLVGAFCSLKSQWFIATFPALTLIYGVIVLIAGLSKIQLTIDMIRKKSKKWFLALISAVLSIACGIVILNNPFTSTTVLWIFTGISLIVESVIDLITLIVSSKKEKPVSEESVQN